MSPGATTPPFKFAVHWPKSPVSASAAPTSGLPVESRFDVDPIGILIPAARPRRQDPIPRSGVQIANTIGSPTPARDALKDHLLEVGIETGVHYPMGLHRMPALGPHVADPEAFPETDRAAAEVLCLPIFPEMTDGEIERVIAAVRASR